MFERWGNGARLGLGLGLALGLALALGLGLGLSVRVNLEPRFKCGQAVGFAVASEGMGMGG